MDQTESYKAKKKFTGFDVDPDDLVIVGIDCEEKDCPELIDRHRVKLDVPDWLVESIARNGVRKEVRVKKFRGDERVFVVDGRQRVRAARIANKRLNDDQKILIKCLPEQGDVLSTMAILNSGSQEETPISKAEKARRMRERGASEEEIRSRFMVTQQTLNDWEAMLGAPPEAIALTKSGKMAAAVATEIGKQAPSKQKAALEAVKKSGKMKGRDAVETVKRAAKGKKPVEAPASGQRKMTTSKVRDLVDILEPTEEEPHEDESVELAYNLLRVVLGESLSLLKKFPHVQKAVRKVKKG